MPDAPLSGFRLLVVEDDADTQEALRSVFELKGAAVTTASSALEGFQSFLRLRPDVIVCDMSMWGPQLILSGTTDVPIVLSSTFFGSRVLSLLNALRRPSIAADSSPRAFS